MTGITKWNDIGDDMFCKSQLITCNRVKECNGVCPFEDALKHADKMQTMNEQHTKSKLITCDVDHDRDWIIGCIEHDGFIHTHRFDKANQIILDALSAETVQGWIPCSERLPETPKHYYDGSLYLTCSKTGYITSIYWWDGWNCSMDEDGTVYRKHEMKDIVAWMPLPTPYKGGDDK